MPDQPREIPRTPVDDGLETLKPSAPNLSNVTPLKPASLAAAPETRLTPEEQMALFEKELKEYDWGHQPC